MVNLDEMVKRLLKTENLSQGKEAAKILGISPADLSNRKKRGTLLPLLIEWAVNNKLNLHWFITGESAPRAISEEKEINPLLIDVNEWLNEEGKHKDAEFRILFQQQMIRAFFDYEEWKIRKEAGSGSGDHYPSSKVA